MQSFTPIHFFVFKIRTIENGFADPKRFRDFRETGPSSVSGLRGGGNPEVKGESLLEEREDLAAGSGNTKVVETVRNRKTFCKTR